MHLVYSSWRIVYHWILYDRRVRHYYAQLINCIKTNFKGTKNWLRNNKKRKMEAFLFPVLSFCYLWHKVRTSDNGDGGGGGGGGSNNSSPSSTSMACIIIVNQQDVDSNWLITVKVKCRCLANEPSILTSKDAAIWNAGCRSRCNNKRYM